MLKSMLAGAIMASAWAICVFFFRFWRKTRERLFFLFAVAFLLLGLERVAMVAVAHESQPFVYLVRLCGFLLIIFAIVDKNRRGT